MIKGKAQTFNSGVVDICVVADISQPGKMPKYGIRLKQTLRYKERTVGVQRHYTALQASVRVDLLLRTPLIRDVSTQDIAVLDNGDQYKIIQIQYPEDVVPSVMDLSLERLVQKYERD